MADPASEYQQYLASLGKKGDSGKPNPKPSVAIAGSPSKAKRGLPGRVADSFRGATSQTTRDNIGGFLQNVVSGERFLKTISGGRVDISGLPGFLRVPLDVAASPLTAVTAGFGPAISGGLRLAGPVGRGLAAVTSPILQGGGFAGRYAAETAVGSLASGAAQQAAERLPEGAPGAVKVGAPLLAAVGAGLVGSGGVAGVRGAMRGDTSIIRNVADVIPGVGLSETVPDTGSWRRGRFLAAPTVENIAADPEITRVVNSSKVVDFVDKSVASTMDKMRESAVVRINSALRTARNEVLGPTKTYAFDDVLKTEQVIPGVIDKRPFIFTKNGQETNPRLGKPALLSEVLPDPRAFDLTPKQLEAIENTLQISPAVRADAELFGAPIENAKLAPNTRFVPREVMGHIDPDTGVFTNVADLAVKDAAGEGGTRLKVLKDREREFVSIEEGHRAGFVYRDPFYTIENYSKTQLKNAQDAHITSLLQKIGHKVEEGVRTPTDMYEVRADDRAPGLRGYVFPKDTAEIITQHFGRGVVPENQVGKALNKIAAFNRWTTPARVVLDFSATLNQAAMLAANNPVNFVKNLARSVAMGFNEKYTADFVSDPRTIEWMRAGGTLFGEGFQGSDFHFGETLRRYPLIKQTQRQFDAMSNTMRRDAYFAAVDTAAKRGRVMGDAEKAALNRALDRIAGISSGRPGDLEGSMLFAPRFLRGHLENIMMAATDGTLEGEVARQYISRYVGVGTLAVASVALMQGRELSEVMNPIDARGLKDGHIRLNPNFATVRVGGNDLSVFGSYDSLARMSLVAGDAVLQSASKQDVREMLEFIDYAASTKGSLALTTAKNLYTGTTFSGDPVVSLPGIAQSYAPFSLADILSSFYDGEDFTTAGTSFAANFLGVKSRAVTPSERRDEAARVRFNVPYTELTGLQRQELDEALPGLRESVMDATQRRADAGDIPSKARIERINLDTARITAESSAYGKFQDGQLNRSQLTEALDQIQQEFAVRKDQSDKSLGIVYADGTGAGSAVSAYYDTYRNAEIAPGKLDWEMRDSLEAQLFEDIAAGKYGDPEKALRAVNERAVTLHSPDVEWYWANKRLIQDKGYYATLDKSFQRYKESASRTAGRPMNSLSAFLQEINAAVAQGEIRKARAMDAVRRKMESVSSAEKKRMVARDADLRIALEQNGKITPKALRVNR